MATPLEAGSITSLTTTWKLASSPAGYTTWKHHLEADSITGSRYLEASSITRAFCSYEVMDYESACMLTEYIEAHVQLNLPNQEYVLIYRVFGTTREVPLV